MSQSADGARLLWLVGFMASGKSSVGRELGRRLGWDFADSDQLVEQRAGTSVAEVFEREGEQRFRGLERQALRECARRSRLVVATGGGAVLSAASRRLMRQSGSVVWLRCPFAIIWERLAGGTAERPLVRGREQLRRLFAEREPLYRFAHVEIDAAQPTAAIVDAILSRLELSGKP